MRRIFSKILILINFLICALSYSQSTLAFADEIKYGRIVTPDCAFYADASCKILKFYLPESYYVKIIAVKSDVSRVVFKDGGSLYPMSEGYVKNVCLELCDSAPLTPYPDINLELTRDEVIFSDVERLSPIVVVERSHQPVFYGDITINGESLLYVYAKGYVGYMSKTAFKEFEVPLLSDYQVKPPENSDSVSVNDSTILSSDSLADDNEFGANEVLIIALIIIVALFIIFLILRPEKSGVKKSRYDNDED